MDISVTVFPNKNTIVEGGGGLAISSPPQGSNSASQRQKLDKGVTWSYAVTVMGKGYELKVKVTRIFLADYLVLRKLSIEAGISMAEALHKLITQQLKPSAESIIPLLTYLTRGSTRSSTRGTTAIATNGSKAAAFRIKPGGVRNE